MSIQGGFRIRSNGQSIVNIPLIFQEDVAETIKVKRTQRIHIPYNPSISYYCHLSKNLWNQAHHIIYGYYKKYGSETPLPSYEELDAILNKKSFYKNSAPVYDNYLATDFDNYHRLGGSTAQQILKVYMKSWKSFFKGLKGYSDDTDPKKDNYTGKPRQPGYKKKDGEFELIFVNKQIKFFEKRDGSVYMTFPKKIDGKPSKLKDVKIKLGNTNDLDPYLLNRLIYGKFDQVKVVPKGVGYWIEIVYDHEVLANAGEIYGLDEDKIMSIDLGVEILCGITDNVGHRTTIIKSEILKAGNQWYNKKMKELFKIYDRQKIGCCLKKDKNEKGEEIIRYLTNKNGKQTIITTDNRNNFVMAVLHVVSRYLIGRALDIKSKTISFTRNVGWKQNVKLGRKTNQIFVQIPHKKLIDMTRYKGEEVGIDVLDFTENHTSKCSFPDSESIKHHDKYMGKRVKRGMFEASNGFRINADINGSYNNLRNTADWMYENRKVRTKFDDVCLKPYPKFSILDVVEGVVAHGLVPERLSISDLMTKNYHQLKNYRLSSVS